MTVTLPIPGTEGSKSDPWGINFSNRFIVYFPGIPSYLIKSANVSSHTLQLKLYILAYKKISTLIKGAKDAIGVIRICYLDDAGKVTDTINVNKYNLVRWSIDGSWDNNKPLELELLYDIEELGSIE